MRSHSLAAPVLAGTMESMAGRGRECQSPVDGVHLEGRGMPPGGGEGGGGCDAGECITRERRKGAALQEKRRKEGWRGLSAGWGGLG